MTISGSEIEYDDDATRAMYAEIPGGINACTCAECGFLEILSTLGIDPKKEIELTHWSAPDDSPWENPADGNFAFVGRILSDRQGKSRHVQDPFDFWVDDDLPHYSCDVREQRVLSGPVVLRRESARGSGAVNAG